MQDSENNGIGWFVAGLSLGALLGVLFAPKSGKETREELAQRTGEGRDYLVARGREAQEQVGHIVDRGREQVTDFAGKAKDQVSDFAAKAKDQADRTRAQWGGLVDKGRDAVGTSAERMAAAMEAGKEAFRASTGTTENHS